LPVDVATADMLKDRIRDEVLNEGTPPMSRNERSDTARGRASAEQLRDLSTVICRPLNFVGRVN